MSEVLVNGASNRPFARLADCADGREDSATINPSFAPAHATRTRSIRTVRNRRGGPSSLTVALPRCIKKIREREKDQECARRSTNGIDSALQLEDRVRSCGGLQYSVFRRNRLIYSLFEIFETILPDKQPSFRSISKLQGLTASRCHLSSLKPLALDYLSACETVWEF